MSLPTRIIGFLALGSALASLPAIADEVRYNQVSLRAEVSQEVAHDRMQVSLYSEAQESDPAKLAAQITRSLNQAVEQARKVKDVSISLGSRNSYPVYAEKGNKIIAWRERAELRLESADFTALSQLTADLLSDLKVSNMSFSIADDSRKKSEDALLKEAIAAFKSRAQIATEALGGSSYRIVNLSLNSSGFARPLAFPMAKAGLAMAADAAPRQEIEAGSSQVSLSADGVIEVK